MSQLLNKPVYIGYRVNEKYSWFAYKSKTVFRAYAAGLNDLFYLVHNHPTNTNYAIYFTILKH
jgi:hypothetical protein